MMETTRKLGSPIDELACGSRLDAYLATHFKFLSREIWQQKIAQGQVMVNGTPTKASYRLKLGESITYIYPPSSEPRKWQEVELLWQHRGIIAINKPPHMPMHENGAFYYYALNQIIRRQFGSSWDAVHRLDKETSGIVLCASEPIIKNRLSEMFASGTIQKTYLALCRGIPPKEKFSVNSPIGEAPPGSKIRIKKWVDKKGKSALTHFTRLATLPHRLGPASLIEAKPKTGRTNQIRIHLASKGFPILGDKLYHADESLFINFVDHGIDAGIEANTGAKRLMLHASTLLLDDPYQGSNQMRCLIHAPMPEDMKALCKKASPLFLNHLGPQ